MEKDDGDDDDWDGDGNEDDDDDSDGNEDEDDDGDGNEEDRIGTAMNESINRGPCRPRASLCRHAV